MSFQTELFGTEKPIIGLLHLKPLPGDPLYYPGGAIASVADAAARRCAPPRSRWAPASATR